MNFPVQQYTQLSRALLSAAPDDSLDKKQDLVCIGASLASKPHTP